MQNTVKTFKMCSIYIIFCKGSLIYARVKGWETLFESIIYATPALG